MEMVSRRRPASSSRNSLTGPSRSASWWGRSSALTGSRARSQARTRSVADLSGEQASRRADQTSLGGESTNDAPRRASAAPPTWKSANVPPRCSYSTTRLPGRASIATSSGLHDISRSRARATAASGVAAERCAVGTIRSSVLGTGGGIIDLSQRWSTAERIGRRSRRIRSGTRAAGGTCGCGTPAAPPARAPRGRRPRGSGGCSRQGPAPGCGR